MVWKTGIGGSLDEVRAQFIGPTGTLVGSAMVLSSGATTVDGSPEVANINETDRFLVTWAESVQSFHWIRMRSVSATSGALSSLVTVASSVGFTLDSPVVGGDSRPSGGTTDYACIVYRTGVPSPRLDVRGVQVFAAADPALIGAAQTVTTGNVSHPSITKHCGTAGRWITAWVHGSTPGGPYQNVACRVIGTFSVPCSAEQQVSIGVPSSDVRDTSVATPDGSEFVVAWEDEVADVVRVRPFVFTGPCPGTFNPGLQVVPVTTPGFQSLPAIEFFKEKYLLSWLHSDAGGTSVCVKGLLPATCASCGVEIAIEGANSSCEPDLVSRWGGGDTASDEGLVVWRNGSIRARRVEAVGDDVVTAMGGGCSLSGFDDFATYTGDAVIGNTDFQLPIANSVSLPLILVLGFGNLSAPCGSCTIVPTLDILLPATNPFTLSMPCDPLLVGQSLYTQWVLLKPSNCPILPDLAFTNALRFTIGE